jgi:peptidyl-tRNA hydrolase, PTH1 family
MKIVAGLGNPGPKYETTRHNAGFLAVDRLVDSWRASGPDDSNQGEIWQASVGGEKVLLVKPQTFMNNSGECIAPLMKFYKCAPGDLIVIYDELDLKPLTMRIKTGGGAGGHNGIKSIDACLGSGQTDYHRVRIGIGHPARSVHPSTQGKHARSVVDYVLQTFTDDELKELDVLLDEVTKAVEVMVQGDVKKAMTEFNREKEAKV